MMVLPHNFRPLEFATNPVPLLIVRESGGDMYQKGTDGNNGSGLACYRQASLQEVQQGCCRITSETRTSTGIDCAVLCGLHLPALPDVPKKLVSAVTDSLPSPIKVMTLSRGAISSGSEIHLQWNPAQCAFVGIGLVLFQLTSEWNWLAGAPW
jgi:hypothetical protein